MLKLDLVPTSGLYGPYRPQPWRIYGLVSAQNEMGDISHGFPQTVKSKLETSQAKLLVRGDGRRGSKNVISG
jgi:hypothetical protein